MTVSRKQFRHKGKKKKLNRDALLYGKNQSRILKFFEEHPDEAFTQKEIKVALKITHNAAVNTALHRLEQLEIIEAKDVHGRVYWSKVNTEEEDE